jgi:hypothetical protein
MSWDKRYKADNYKVKNNYKLDISIHEGQYSTQIKSIISLSRNKLPEYIKIRD